MDDSEEDAPDDVADRDKWIYLYIIVHWLHIFYMNVSEVRFLDFAVNNVNNVQLRSAKSISRASNFIFVSDNQFLKQMMLSLSMHVEIKKNDIKATRVLF